MRTPIAYFVVLSGILFTLGTLGVLLRKNALLIFMSVELQLNAVNLALVAFSRMHLALDGQVIAFFSMVVAAAEVVVGLAIIVAVYRRRGTVDVDQARARRLMVDPRVLVNIDWLWVVPVLPLGVAVVNLFLGRRLGKLAGWIASAAVGISFLLSLEAVRELLGARLRSGSSSSISSTGSRSGTSASGPISGWTSCRRR